MSIIRFGEDGSDIYIYESTFNNQWSLCCAGCLLCGGKSYYTHDEPANRFDVMIEHVEEHIAEGHQVPDGVISEIKYRKED